MLSGIFDRTAAPPGKNEPFSESSHAFFQVSAGVELGICDRLDGNFWEGMTDEGADVVRKSAEGVIAALIPFTFSAMTWGMELRTEAAEDGRTLKP